MKKLFLLLLTGVVCATANAQQNNSVMLTRPGSSTEKFRQHPRAVTPNHKLTDANTHNRAARTSAAPFNDWFDYWDENAISGTSVGYYFNVYPDSNLTDGTNYNFTHGLGMSFDPCDDNYYSYNPTTSAGITDPNINENMAYVIDSFFVAGKYMRFNPSSSVVDSLIIDLVATTTGTVDSGTYLLQFPADANYATISPDNIGRFAAALFTPNTSTSPRRNELYDTILALGRQRYAIALDANFFSDTDVNGDHNLDFALTTPLYVEPGMKVVSYVTFKSSVAYAFGTLYSSANYYHLYAGDPGGASVWPVQSVLNAGGSYQDGLIVQNQDGYDAPATSFTYMNHYIPIPGVAFMQPSSAGAPTTPTGVDVPEQAFHVLYDTTGSTTAVRNVTGAINTVRAYPNPATGILNVSYNLSNSAEVTVSLTNVLGQVVASKNAANSHSGTASFNTTTLPAGVYIYTVLANGQRTTGQVVIAH